MIDAYGCSMIENWIQLQAKMSFCYALSLALGRDIFVITSGFIKVLEFNVLD